MQMTRKRKWRYKQLASLSAFVGFPLAEPRGNAVQVAEEQLDIQRRRRVSGCLRKELWRKMGVIPSTLL